MQLKSGPGAIAILVVFFSVGVSCSEPQLEWITPSAGDAFRPGDSVVGKWKVDKAVVSPSFQLCLGSGQSSVDRRAENNQSSGNCGGKVYPTVQQDGGVYSISLSVPNATSDVEACYLLMQDDFGNSYRSPSFSVSDSAPSDESKDVISPQSPDAQSPIGMSSSSLASSIVTVTAIPIPSNAPDTLSNPGSSAYTTRNSPPVAAFAVPLSIVGAILLVAVALWFRHNKKFQEERIRDLEKLKLERKESSCSMDSLTDKKSAFSRQSDIEHALDVLLKRELSYTLDREAPVPLFMPVQFPTRREREPRRSTREPYILSRDDSYTQRQSRSHTKESIYSAFSNRKMPVLVPSSGPPSSYQSSVTLCSPSRAPSVIDPYRPHSRNVDPHLQDHYLSSTSPTSDRHIKSQIPSRSHSRASSQRTNSSRPCLPPIQTGLPLYSSRRELRDREIVAGEGHVTDSVLDDYLLPSPYDAQAPPTCLMPAPQRLHTRNAAVDAPARVEEEEMEDIDLYDAVANNLRRGYHDSRY